jgi:hypothetical protein
MLDRAKFLITSEIAEVEGKPITTIEERVEKALARTFEAAPQKVRQQPVGAKRKKSDA